MQTDVAAILDLLQEEMHKIGRDPKDIEIMTGCPEALPGSGHDALEVIKEKQKQGIQKVVLPLDAFLPDMEPSILRFGEEIIRKTK